MKVEGASVFISDGDNPFGAAITRRFAEGGARIVVNTRSQRSFASPAGASEIIPVEVDPASPQAVEAMLDRLAAPIGVYVHTARCVVRAEVESCSQAQFDLTLRENLKSAFVCTQAIGRRMADRGGGKIIYLGSIHAEKPTRSSFAYGVAMGALKMLCREAALELGRRGVTVNLIEMGPVEGDDELFGDELFPLYASYRAKIPGGGPGGPDDAAELAFFLASQGARYVNGATIRLDGGFLLHYLDNKLPASAREGER